MAYVGPVHRRQGVYSEQHWTPSNYALLRTHFAYLVQDVLVEGTLVETYQARRDVDFGAAHYVFQVPPGASVVDFGARIDGRARVHARVDDTRSSSPDQAPSTAGVQAWKLDPVHEKVLQISLGAVPPSSVIEISVTYVYVIARDTLQDSARLSIPTGFERDGASPMGVAAIPTAPTGPNAVTLTVGVEVHEDDVLFDLNSTSHRATITGGWSDDSFKQLSPAAKRATYRKCKSYVEFASDTFLQHDFVLVWTVWTSDRPRCVAQKLAAPVPGQPETCAVALTLVSTVDLEPAEHEYIFLVDCSHSMAGPRITMANHVVKTMLAHLPTHPKSSFNIYSFGRWAWSILPGGKSLALDAPNVAATVPKLATTTTTTADGSDISNALTAALSRRQPDKPRCSVIVLTDGVDVSGVAQAVKSVRSKTAEAAAQSTLLRVFAVGLGDDARGLCEGLAGGGTGATRYIATSLLHDGDYGRRQSAALVEAMNRAPIRVRSIDWGYGGGGVATHDHRKQQGNLGAGDNLPAVAPLPTDWAVRSCWYFILRRGGAAAALTATIQYDIAGSAASARTMQVPAAFASAGRLVHAIAARTLIKGLEQTMTTLADAHDKDRAEAEIVRLGRTYGLASSQTCLVAVVDGAARMTYGAGGGGGHGGRSVLSGVPLGGGFRASFVNLGPAASQTVAAASTSAPDVQVAVARPKPPPPANVLVASEAHTDKAAGTSKTTMTASPACTFQVAFATQTLPQGQLFLTRDVVAQGCDAPVPETACRDEVARVSGAQDGNGAFDARVVGRILFPDTGCIPAVPAVIAALRGRERDKDQMWLVLCVMAYLRARAPGREREWADAHDRATYFVKTSLCCVFDVFPGRSEEVMKKSLAAAEGYFG